MKSTKFTTKSVRQAIKIKPVTPFVASHEKECSDCVSFLENVDPANKLGWCTRLAEPTMKYDECGAFIRT